MIDTGSVYYAKEIGSKQGSRMITGRGFKELKEDDLSDVLRIRRVADKPVCYAPYQGLIAKDNLFESMSVPVSR